MEQPLYMEEDLNAFTTSSKFATTMETKHDTKGNNRTWHPVYRVVQKRRWGKWVSNIKEPHKRCIYCQWNSCGWVFVSDSSWLDRETQTQQHFLACL
ncbi:hypothetical protein Gotri_027011 [Gossypium trilobum]|uniref:AP2/ERF domain-containing protein n=1 Tax=Gossypium trilobum TaxID=34281 RepID=A0A7J9FQC8_9ROSI|nr:hypothetical protein [Gossypium trilobum]